MVLSRALLLLIIVFWTCECLGQVLDIKPQLLDFETIKVEEGLPASYVGRTIEDRHGKIWIGTSEGLSSYDGHKVESYTNDPSDSLSISSDKIVPIYFDSNDNLWVLNRFSNLNYFDSKHKLFYKSKVLSHKSGSYSSFRDDHDHLWIEVKESTWVVSKNNDPKVAISDLVDETNVNFIPIEKRFNGIERKPECHRIYILKNDIYYIENDTLFSYSLNYDNYTAKIKFKTLLSHKLEFENYYKNKLAIDSNRNKVFIFGNHQYCELNKSTGKLFNCFYFGQNNHKPNVHIVDSNGTIWLSMLGIGLVTLNPDKNKFNSIHDRQFPEINFAYKQYVVHISEDRNNNLWISTNADGVFKYNLARSKFKYISDAGSPFQLLDDRIVFLENHKNLNLFYFDEETKSIIDTIQSLHLNFFPLKDGFILMRFSEMERLLYKYNLKGQPIRRFNKEISRPYDEIFFLFHEGERFWSGYDMYKESREFDFVISSNNEFLTDYKEEASLTSQWKLFAISQSLNTKDSTIWCSFLQGGILSYNRQSQQWKQYSPLSNNNQKLTSNKVFSMHLDPIYPDSIIWVGTNLGVDRLNFITNEVTNISTKNGLPNNVIYGILADKRNNLWMSSNRGLFVVDPKDNSLVMTFDADDGLQHLEFNKYGSGRTKSGIFFFQGIRGMNYFNPEDFYLDTKPSRLIFTSMRLSNEDVKIKRNKVDNNKSDFQLESSLEYMPKISLPHTERIITFEFSLLDLSNPKKNKYRYKLKGQNENWIELGNQNNVILTNLDPGSYELQVQAIGTHSNWESQEANLNFTIQPPWWKTWWFKLIILGLICLLIYLFISYKRNQAIQLELLRNRISRDLHDDIGSTLSSISLFGTLALKNLKSQNSTVEKMLDKINSGALQVMESLNDIVWTISTDNNKVEDLINRMRAYISGFEDTDEWQIDFNFNENILNNTLTMVQRRNIYLIFKESVNNAIKYSSGHRIKVYIAIRNNLFELIMTDDGKGFNYEEVKKMNTLGGNGIKNMKNRAKEIKGNLEFDSIKDIGTKVKFTFNTKSER